MTWPLIRPPACALALVPLIMVAATPAFAQGAIRAATLADPATIDRDVAVFTGQPIGAPGGAARPVDRRLRLAACATPLALSWHGDARSSILVECPDVGSWRIFVAVSAASGESARQIAAAPAIERGQGVTVAVSGEGFSVSQPGEALEAGVVGGWIKVRTQPKADPVEARIVRPGLVEVLVE